MQFAVTFRHMEPTEALKSYARERMERVRKYLPDPISCHVVLSTERHNHRIDVTFQLHNGLAVSGHEIGSGRYLRTRSILSRAYDFKASVGSMCRNVTANCIEPSLMV